MNTIALNTEQLLADLVAGVFIWSGAAKLWKPLPAAMAAVDFGILTRVSPVVGISLGTIELCVGGWILSEVWIVPAMIAASALLLIFGALIATAVVRGKSFSCACFGDAEGAISKWTLARAVVLLATAVVATSSVGGEHRVGELTFDDVGVWTTVAAALGSCVLISKIPGLLSWNRDPYSIGRVT